MNDVDSSDHASNAFGPQAAVVAARVTKALVECHDRFAAGQDIMKTTHTGAYGIIWHGILEEFRAALSSLPGAEMRRVGRYHLVAINGVLIFPWRYGRDQTKAADQVKFGKSGSRLALFEVDQSFVQPSFDFESGGTTNPGESNPDVEHDEDTLRNLIRSKARVVLVAFVSNPSALISARWGEATLTDSKEIEFSWLADLEVTEPLPVAVPDWNSGDSFTSGAIPRPKIDPIEEAL